MPRSSDPIHLPIKCGNVESVLPMIAKKARATYHKLPAVEQAATSVADLIAEGRNHAVTHVAKKYNPRLKVKFITLLFKSLDNFYADKLKAAYAEKRKVSLLSIDSDVVNGIPVAQLVRKSTLDVIEDRIIARIDAERAFVRAYAESSKLLRQYLIMWLLQPLPNGKIKDGVDARLAVEELRRIAPRLFTRELCESMFNDIDLRLRLANRIMSEFFTVRKELKVATKIEHTVESKVLPLLSSERRKSCIALV